jgi:CHAT domain-containing protein
MKKILLFEWSSMLVLTFWSAIGFPQCPQPAAEWMHQITAIENKRTALSALRVEQIAQLIEQLTQLKSSYEVCTTTKDSITARILHRLGDFYSSTGTIDKAISYTRMAVAINRADHSGAQKAFLANSYFNLGLFYKDLNFFEESIAYFDSCITVAKQYPGKKSIALKALEKKAFFFFTTGDYQRSIEIADYGLLLAKDIQDIEFEAMLLVQKAQSQLALNQLPEAETNIKAAIQILSELNKELNLATSYSVYANLLERKKDFAESITYYKKAYELNFQREKISQCTRVLTDLGGLYDNELKEPAKALACYTKSVKLIQHTGDSYLLALIYNNMGVFYWGQKNFLKALQYFHKGLTVLPIGFADTLLQNNPTPARLKLVTNDQILSILLANKGEMFLEMYRKEHNKQYLTYALSTFQAADQAVDQMRWKQNADQSKLFWREKTKNMYENAIETCYLLQDTRNAFFFFEKSRAVLLNDRLSELGAQKYLTKADLEKEQQLRIRLFSLEQQLAALKGATDQYQQVNLQWFATQESYEKFIKSLEKRHPAYYQYKYDTITYAIPEIQSKLLGGDQSMIEYFTGDEYIYMLVIKPDTATISRIEAKSYLASANELLKLCSSKALLNQNYPRYRQLAQQLYENLFKPLSIHTKRVIISPDEQLFPFELLLTDRANPASFLLQKYAFRYAYSAGLLMKNSQAPSPVNPTLLGIAPIDYRPYLKQQPLQGADLSLENIKTHIASSHFLIGEKATKKEFLKSLPSHALVHLYSHAEADSTGKEPVLYLHDSTLNVSELQLLGKLPTRLIILSACNTATGRNVRGEGVFSLARGFAAAGIPASLTTLWQIDNQTTYQLSELFYKYLSQGVASDEALREAKLEFLASHDKSYELPYFWAASILIGNSDRFREAEHRYATSSPYLIAGMLLILCIVSASLFYIKKRSLKSANTTL